MFKQLVKIFVLSVISFKGSAQTLKIVTTDTIQIIVFQDSKMVHNHIMFPTDELILDKSKPLLIQWKGSHMDPYISLYDFVRINEYGYFELLFDLNLEQRIKPWWYPFGISFIELRSKIFKERA